MSGPWYQRLQKYARENGLDDGQVAMIQKFLDEAMRVDSVEVSLGDTTMADLTTQAFTVNEGGHGGADPLAMPETPEDRYLDVGRLGIGGMGEVRRVRDGVFNRFVAMKIIRAELASRPAAVMRFVAEAQATAQLQHPGMPPVHDLGRLADGRWYFTMKELSGQTFAEVLDAYRVGAYPRGLRGVIAILARVAEAVAYAHENGAVHRDLKPSNILVGEFGEVIVLDWGLVKASGAPDGRGVKTDLGGVHTRLGQVIGTPSYMSPEQAAGRQDQIGAPTDVYALGAILYEVLAGRRPYNGDAKKVLAELLEGPPPPVPQTSPAALVDICEQAMARMPDDRHANATAFKTALEDWLDGAARRDRALALLEKADALQPVVEGALDDSATLLERAQNVLERVPAWASSEAKREGWMLEDQARKRRIDAELAGVERLQLLRSALNELPGMQEAAERLAYVYHFCHHRAERMGDAREAAQYEALLRAHDTGEYASYLAGDGQISLRTRPACSVTVHRMVTRDRRLVPEPMGELPDTPFERAPLGAGSYLLELRAPDRAVVNYPVFIERSGHWHGREPGGRAPSAVLLPSADDIGSDDCYVPAGWAMLGPKPSQPVWVDGFVIKRFPVTVKAFVEFLNALVEAGELARAEAAQPRDTGRPILSREGERFVLPDLPAWGPDMAVSSVSHHAARDYAVWYAGRTGEPWRLPWEAEWEKAARGVDGRPYVFGDHIDPAWAEIRDSSPDEVPRPVGTFPQDCSVYGVRDLTGGCGDWCNDRFDSVRMLVHEGQAVHREAMDEDRAVVRGGFRTAPTDLCRAWFRHAVPATKCSIRVGFRLARGIEIGDEADRHEVFRLNG